MPPRVTTKGPPKRKPFWSKGLQYALIGALLLAPLLALLIQFSRVPDEFPAPAATVRPRALAPFIAGLLANPKASDFDCSLDEINVHLAQVLPLLRKNPSGVTLQGLELRLEPGAITALSTCLWRNREWHVRIRYHVAVEAGRLQVRADSGSLGRFHIGPRWTGFLQTPLVKLLPLLKKETVLLNRLESLRLEPNRAVLKVRASVTTPSS
jgi:hypothetical protein